MPNQLDGTGLQVKTQLELLTYLTTGFQSIYGDDINLDSDTPDGQLLFIFMQAILDNLELDVLIYNMFDPENCSGVQCDNLFGINGIPRHPGTFTYVPITVITAGALTLTGLDAAINDINGTGYTVADGAGVQYILSATEVITVAGTYVLSFRAANIGLVQPTLNTITNQITYVTGVTSVNNPSAPTIIGQDEETDARFKVRRSQSFFLGALSAAESLEAALLQIPGIVDASVIENTTTGTVNTIPANSWWIILNNAGSVADLDIATVIHTKRTGGCGIKSNDSPQSYSLNRPNGQTKTYYWHNAISQKLYIKFTTTAKYSGETFDNTFIAGSLATALIYKLGVNPSISDIIVAMQTIEPDAILSDVYVSTDGTNWYQVVNSTSSLKYFTLYSVTINSGTPIIL